MSVGLSTITDSYYEFRSNDGEAELEPPVKLYGRESESLVLQQAYEEVAVNAKHRSIFIHGESGTGKTTFVDSLRHTICDSQGFFCAGKYFQNAGIQEPYSAIMAAFSDLCDLVIQSDDFNEERRSEIQQGLGSDGHMLAKAISNLSSFLDESLFVGDFDPRNDAALAMFLVACKTFLRTMASANHPVTIFLDDIQWADEGSRRLIRFLLKDVELKHVMIILAYRDEEASSVQDLLKEASDMVDIVDIEIKNLQPESVYKLVSQRTKRNDISQDERKRASRDSVPGSHAERRFAGIRYLLSVLLL